MPQNPFCLKNQNQINKLNLNHLNGKKERYIKVSKINCLFVRMQRNKIGFSASYVCRFTKSKQSCYHFIGSIYEIKLTEAVSQCIYFRSIFKNDFKLVLDLKNGNCTFKGVPINLDLSRASISLNTGQLPLQSNESTSNEPAPSNYQIVIVNNAVNPVHAPLNIISHHQAKTIDELFNEYCVSRNIKDNTVKSYKTAIAGTCGRDWSKLITEISPTTINTNFGRATLVQYLIILKSLFSYAQACNYISQNPFLNTSNIIVTSVVKHRAALNCEDFDTLEDGELAVGNFLQRTLEASKQTPQKRLFELWLLHMVLATRISETARIIKIYYGLNEHERAQTKYLKIETKTTKKDQEANFRVPLIPKVKRLLEKVCHNLGHYCPEYIKKLISASIPEDFRSQIKAHGSRAIYRTIIDFITPVTTDIRAKEYYLSHEIQNKVAQSYSRNDLIQVRIEIQELYLAWLDKLLKNYCGLTNFFEDNTVKDNTKT